MRSWRPVLLALIFLRFFAGPLAMPTRAACPDNQLIALTVERDGIAGTTGYEWSIFQDGKWSKSRISLDKTGTHRERLEGGSLTPQELKHVEEAIGKSEFASLPDQIGEAPKVNAQRHSLEVNGKRVCLFGVSSRGAKDLAKQIENYYGTDGKMGEDAHRFLDLMRAVETSVAGNAVMP